MTRAPGSRRTSAFPAAPEFDGAGPRGHLTHFAPRHLPLQAAFARATVAASPNCLHKASKPRVGHD